jgi:hypothetical protein
VLAQGEAFRLRVQAPGGDAAPRPAAVPATPQRIAVQYLRFDDVEGRREYAFRGQRGDDTRLYTVWIELAAFARREALLQDGPDICYQKLLRELTGSDVLAADRICVTELDLATYRQTHAPAPRKTSASARAAWTAQGQPDPPASGGGERG